MDGCAIGSRGAGCVNTVVHHVWCLVLRAVLQRRPLSACLSDKSASLGSLKSRVDLNDEGEDLPGEKPFGPKLATLLAGLDRSIGMNRRDLLVHAVAFFAQNCILLFSSFRYQNGEDRQRALRVWADLSLYYPNPII